jgi:hypothetical protein
MDGFDVREYDWYRALREALLDDRMEDAIREADKLGGPVPTEIRLPHLRAMQERLRENAGRMP